MLKNISKIFLVVSNSFCYLCVTKQKNMKTVEIIIRNTNPKQVVKGENMVKGMYGKNRQVVVNYDKAQDLFNVWAFTLKGTNFTKETKLQGLFLCQLKETIQGLI